MESKNKFKKYFNKDFWRAFKGKKIIIQDLPEDESAKNQFIEKLYQEISEKSYFPSIPKLFLSHEKLNGIPRFSPVFELKDYCVYYYCIKKFEKQIAINRTPFTYGGWTLGGLLRQSENDEIKSMPRTNNNENTDIYIGAYSYNPLAWSKSYGDLNAKLFEFSKVPSYSHVLMLDIANFYDNIRLDLLEQKIRNIANASDLDIVNLLFTFLNYWDRNRIGYNRQVVGLPQDALGDFSRLLANFYLQDYDSKMHIVCKKADCKYVRYADDQFIFLKSINLAPKIAFLASSNLNLINLSINQMKVKIMTTGELIRERSFEIFNILPNDESKKSKIKVENFAKEYIKLLDANGLDKLKNRGTPLLNKLLFCPALSEIDISTRQKVIGCYLDEHYLKNANSKQLFKIYELLEENGKNEFIDKLVNMSKGIIFNTFHYQVLDFFKNINISKDNITIIKENLLNLNDLYNSK
jgi:hypothetical protein